MTTRSGKLEYGYRTIRSPMIIINADDFGMSEEVNRAIVSCFHEGVISSTTIMANMPGFEDACHLAVQNKRFKSIGIHLNISERTPITKRILREPKLCNADGKLCFQRNTVPFFTQNERAALTEEMEAQIQRCLDMGVSLTHLDSHHHVHTEWSVFELIRPLIRKYGIQFVRQARNDNAGQSILRKCYKTFFNIRLSHMGLRKTVYFGDLEGFRAMRVRKKGRVEPFEIMVHPVFGKNGRIVDKIDGTEIIPIIRELTKGITLSPFSSEKEY